MSGPLFITGATGFIGLHLLRRLSAQGHPDVRCVARKPEQLAQQVPPLPRWRYIPGDLEQSASYAAGLAGAETVVHLGATTGKAPRSRHFAVNLAGTQALLERSAHAGVERFLFISTIAAKFADQRHYPYAQAKARAEAAVTASGIGHTILRPTMVLGRGSPVWDGFRRLAAGPIGIVFGEGRTKVQPIYVDDLVACILSIVTDLSAKNDLLEAGGPEAVSIGDLLRTIRQAIRGQREPWIHLPLRPLREVLGALEPLLLPVLPMTSGQLASFAQDGVADPNPLTERLRPSMKTIGDMLRLLTAHG